MLYKYREKRKKEHKKERYAHTKSLYMIEPVYSFGRLNVVVRQRGSVMKQRGEGKQDNRKRNVSPNQQRVYLLLCDYYITERIKRVACSIENMHTFIEIKRRYMHTQYK